MLNIFRTFIL